MKSVTKSDSGFRVADDIIPGIFKPLIYVGRNFARRVVRRGNYLRQIGQLSRHTSLSVHLLIGALEGHDSEEDKCDEHADLKKNPERRPYCRRYSLSASWS